MKIIFVINSLDAGGAEKVASQLINKLSKKYIVHLVTRKKRDSFFFKINDEVEITSIEVAGKENKILSSIYYLFNLSKIFQENKPAFIISFMTETNLLSILAYLLSGTRHLKIAISERTNPEAVPISTSKKILRFFLYRISTFLILQTNGPLNWAKSIGAKKICRIITNPINEEELRNKSVPNFKPEVSNFILSIGRLTYEKGHDLLIKSFSLVPNRDDTLHLIIIGDGAERHKLEELAHKLGIKDKVLFLGKKENIIDYLLHTRLFVLPSRFEGFPNVLAEALVLGIPSVSFDCQYGPQELLTGPLKEFLVKANDVNALGAKMSQMLACKKIKNFFDEESKSIKVKLSIDKVCSEWEKLILNT